MFLFNEEKLHSAVAVVTGYIAVLFFNLRLNAALIHYLNVLLMGMKFSDFTNFVFTVPVNKSDNKRYKNIGGVGGGGFPTPVELPAGVLLFSNSCAKIAANCTYPRLL